MTEAGQNIILKDIKYTIYEHDTAGIPYRLVDENNNAYLLQLKDDRADKYYMLDGLFRTKGTITKEELNLAMNPPTITDYLYSGVWTHGGIVLTPTTP